MDKTVEFSVAGAIGTIELNRPGRLNAINPALLDDLAGAFDEAARTEVAAIVLQGAGRAFCAGDDLKEFDQQTASADETRRFVETIQAVTRRIVHADAVVIGAVQGWAVGGGLEWMLNCDLAVMADDGGFFFPEIELGLFPTGGASTLLPNLVGLSKAKELLLLGERHDAATALSLGLVNRVVPRAELIPTAYSLAERIAALPPVARRNTKHVLNVAFRESIETAMARETEATIAGFLDPGTASRVGGRLT